MGTVNLAGLAAQLGVNKSTVSRALRGDPRVAAETRERVREAAQAAGYRPHAAAAALSQARWQTEASAAGGLVTVNMGYLGVARTEAALRKSPQFGYTRAAAERRGFALVPVVINDAVTPAMVNRRLVALNLQVMILGRVNYMPGVLTGFGWGELAWERSAWVAAGEGGYAPPCHRVLFNAFADTLTALRALAAGGAQRIAVLHGPTRTSHVIERQQAAVLSFQANHPELAVLEVEVPEEGEAVGGADWSARVEAWGPDVVLAVYGGLRERASGALRALPWTTMGARQGERGLVTREEELATAAVELAEMQYRRGSFGLPAKRHTLMLDGEWEPGMANDQ